jgi:geranylgeranyl reductase family protein
VTRYDAIVVGAGPAGSVTAYRLASAGRSVLLLDKAVFPRDKPCGGGLTLRAVRQLPFSVEPVVEHRVERMAFRLGYGPGYERRAREPIILMTQRRRLDRFLAQQAVAAGAEWRQGVKVTAAGVGEGGVEVEAGGETHSARVLVGADGANGVVAREVGLAGEPIYGVALEGNLPHARADAARFEGRAVLELGTIPGGYGWVFPKGDHLNFGVGGWEHEGPKLRDHLRRLCDEHGVDHARLEQVRGHRLPLRRPETPLARGRALVVGDAAGLVDPLSGDGMYECFVSARHAAEAIESLLAGSADDLLAYDAAVRRTLGRMAAASWGAKHAFDRFPRIAFTLSRPPFVWPVVEGLLRGDISHPGAARGIARGPLKVVDALSRLTGSPGPRYRVEGA